MKRISFVLILASLVFSLQSPALADKPVPRANYDVCAQLSGYSEIYAGGTITPTECEDVLSLVNRLNTGYVDGQTLFHTVKISLDGRSLAQIRTKVTYETKPYIGQVTTYNMSVQLGNNEEVVGEVVFVENELQSSVAIYGNRDAAIETLKRLTDVLSK